MASGGPIDFRDLTLARVILRAIREHTGREVVGSEVYAFGDYVSVTCRIDEDGSIDVEFQDPNQGVVESFS